MARPTLYTEQLADKICEHIATGRSLVSFCKQEGAPDYTSIMAWLDKYPEFLNKYTRARENQADWLADNTLDVADDDSIPSDQKRIMVDTRKWIASKMKPKKYGDSRQVDLTAKLSLTDLTEEQLNAELKRLAAEAGIGLAVSGEGEA